MGKPVNSAKPKPKAVKSDISWVNYTLSAEQKAELKAQVFDLDNAVLRVIEEGYKLSLGYDSYNECYTAFLIPNDPNHVHIGMILSGRGSTPSKAIKQACYIHWQIFDGDWSDARPPKRDELDD